MISICIFIYFALTYPILSYMQVIL